MVKINDFEKRYVSTIIFNEGDKILVTAENIEFLRKALNRTNLHWGSGHHITDMEAPIDVDGEIESAFGIDRVIELYEKWSHTQLIYEMDEDDFDDVKDAVNYVFVNY